MHSENIQRATKSNWLKIDATEQLQASKLSIKDLFSDPLNEKKVLSTK